MGWLVTGLTALPTPSTARPAPRRTGAVTNRLTAGPAASAAPAAYLYGGGAAESAASVIATFDNLIGRAFYAASAGPSASDQNVLDFNASIQAMNNKHVYVHTTQDVAALGNDTARLVAYLKGQIEGHLASTVGKIGG